MILQVGLLCSVQYQRLYLLHNFNDVFVNNHYFSTYFSDEITLTCLQRFRIKLFAGDLESHEFRGIKLLLIMPTTPSIRLA